MGSFNSGRIRGNRKKGLTCDFRKLDIRSLDKRQLKDSQFILKARDFEESIDLAESDCHLGGSRKLFICNGCQTRRLILYLSEDGFRCQKCLGLAHPTQSLSPVDRLIYKRDKIGKALNKKPGNRKPVRPKGMHWKRYFHLLKKWHEAEDQAFLHLSEKIG